MNKISILIVEDEVKLLEAYSKYISLFCDTIFTATNGEEALAVYKKHHPDIILTDMNMPKISGIELIQEIRKTDEQIKIIVLSAYTDTEKLLEAIKLHLVSYLVKPVKMDDLKKTILQTIDELSLNIQILLKDGYLWNNKTNSLIYQNEVIDLTGYENSFVKYLVSKANNDVSYEDLHYFIYQHEEYSLSAISSLVKRIRKKTSKHLIKSSYKFGYKIETSI